MSNFHINGIDIYIMLDFFLDKSLPPYIINEETIPKKSIIFVTPSWYNSPKTIRIANSNPTYNIVIMANSEEEKKLLQKNVQCDVIFCNQNAFLNENNFNIDYNNEIKYDLVVDSCFTLYKNVNICNKISNTIHIGYIKPTRPLLIPTFGTLANYDTFNRYKKLNKKLICNIYNQSYVAGIFSLEEGACFASTQYLLAGLPVISTKSIGGRDIWYNSNNSIICENNENDCYKCFQIAKEKLINGEFNRINIRNNTVELMNKHRNIFIECLINKLKQLFDLEVNPNELNINLSIY